MSPALSDSEFARVHRARIKRARENAGMTQAQVANVLGLTLEAYKKIENRSMTGLAPFLVERFCILTGASAQALYTRRLDPNDAAIISTKGQKSA